MIDYTSNSTKDAITLRSIGVRIEVDLWDWNTPNGFVESVDITDSIVSFNFSKTLRAAMGNCSINMVPLIKRPAGLAHVLDVINTMDVIRIFEFDKLKFQGYVRHIGTTQSISSGGQPTRMVAINAIHIGGLLQEATVGFELLALRIDQIDKKLKGFESRIIKLCDAISNKMKDGGVLVSDIISTLVDEWFTLLDALGATLYKTYLNKYIDFKSGLSQFSATRVLPSELSFFYGSNSTMSLWSELQKLCEAPFNEIFFDEGPRGFWYPSSPSSGASGGLDSSNASGTAMVTAGVNNAPLLPNEKTYLIGRPTPFDGTVRYGNKIDYFKMMPIKTLPLNWVTQFDVSKSSEESYSLYCAVPLYAAFNEVTLMCAGFTSVDESMINKYLLRPMIMKLFYATVSRTESTGQVSFTQSFEKEMKYATQTLQNWFKNNDRFLSGVCVMNVPKEYGKDVYIGEKIKFDGVDGYFYVEGISHSWTYGQKLDSHLTITRGWDYDKDKPIKLANKFFMGAGFLAKEGNRHNGML